MSLALNIVGLGKQEQQFVRDFFEKLYNEHAFFKKAYDAGQSTNSLPKIILHDALELVGAVRIASFSDNEINLWVELNNSEEYFSALSEIIVHEWRHFYDAWLVANGHLKQFLVDAIAATRLMLMANQLNYVLLQRAAILKPHLLENLIDTHFDDGIYDFDPMSCAAGERKAQLVVPNVVGTLVQPAAYIGQCFKARVHFYNVAWALKTEQGLKLLQESCGQGQEVACMTLNAAPNVVELPNAAINLILHVSRRSFGYVTDTNVYAFVLALLNSALESDDKIQCMNRLIEADNALLSTMQKFGLSLEPCLGRPFSPDEHRLLGPAIQEPTAVWQGLVGNTQTANAAEMADALYAAMFPDPQQSAEPVSDNRLMADALQTTMFPAPQQSAEPVSNPSFMLDNFWLIVMGTGIALLAGYLLMTMTCGKKKEGKKLRKPPRARR